MIPASCLAGGYVFFSVPSQGVSCVDLVNQTGSEGLLEAAFAGQAKRYASSRSAALTYAAFDFHKELGAANYAR